MNEWNINWLKTKQTWLPHVLTLVFVSFSMCWPPTLHLLHSPSEVRGQRRSWTPAVWTVMWQVRGYLPDKDWPPAGPGASAGPSPQSLWRQTKPAVRQRGDGERRGTIQLYQIISTNSGFTGCCFLFMIFDHFSKNKTPWETDSLLNTSNTHWLQL